MQQLSESCLDVAIDEMIKINKDHGYQVLLFRNGLATIHPYGSSAMGFRGGTLVGLRCALMQELEAAQVREPRWLWNRLISALELFLVMNPGELFGESDATICNSDPRISSNLACPWI